MGDSDGLCQCAITVALFVCMSLLVGCCCKVAVVYPRLHPCTLPRLVLLISGVPTKGGKNKEDGKRMLAYKCEQISSTDPMVYM